MSDTPSDALLPDGAASPPPSTPLQIDGGNGMGDGAAVSSTSSTGSHRRSRSKSSRRSDGHRSSRTPRTPKTPTLSGMDGSGSSGAEMDERERKRKKEQMSTCGVVEGHIIASRFRLAKWIGQGTYSSVWKGVEIDSNGHDNGHEVAVKIAKPSADGADKILKHESHVLRNAQRNNNEGSDAQYRHVCGYITHGPPSSDNRGELGYLVMDLAGKNLSETRKSQVGRPDRALLGAQNSLGMFYALKYFHDSGHIHRDIKPSNFMFPARQPSIQAHPPAPHVLVVDFGLAKIRRAPTGEPAAGVGFRGTSMYASIKAHDELEHGVLEDLWSLFYCVVHMVVGELPWERLVKEVKHSAKPKEEIKISKVEFGANIHNHLAAWPSLIQLAHLLSSSTGTIHEHAPDYEAMEQLLRELCTSEQIKYQKQQAAMATAASSSAPGGSMLSSLSIDTATNQNNMSRGEASYPRSSHGASSPTSPPSQTTHTGHHQRSSSRPGSAPPLNLDHTNNDDNDDMDHDGKQTTPLHMHQRTTSGGTSLTGTAPIPLKLSSSLSSNGGTPSAVGLQRFGSGHTHQHMPPTSGNGSMLHPSQSTLHWDEFSDQSGASVPLTSGGPAAAMAVAPSLMSGGPAGGPGMYGNIGANTNRSPASTPTTSRPVPPVDDDEEDGYDQEQRMEREAAEAEAREAAAAATAAAARAASPYAHAQTPNHGNAQSLYHHQFHTPYNQQQQPQQQQPAQDYNTTSYGSYYQQPQQPSVPPLYGQPGYAPLLPSPIPSSGSGVNSGGTSWPMDARHSPEVVAPRPKLSIQAPPVPEQPSDLPLWARACPVDIMALLARVKAHGTFRWSDFSVATQKIINDAAATRRVALVDALKELQTVNSDVVNAAKVTLGPAADDDALLFSIFITKFLEIRLVGTSQPNATGNKNNNNTNSMNNKGTNNSGRVITPSASSSSSSSPQSVHKASNIAPAHSTAHDYRVREMVQVLVTAGLCYIDDWTHDMLDRLDGQDPIWLRQCGEQLRASLAQLPPRGVSAATRHSHLLAVLHEQLSRAPVRVPSSSASMTWNKRSGYGPVTPRVKHPLHFYVAGQVTNSAPRAIAPQPLLPLPPNASAAHQRFGSNSNNNNSNNSMSANASLMRLLPTPQTSPSQSMSSTAPSSSTSISSSPLSSPVATPLRPANTSYTVSSSSALPSQRPQPSPHASSSSSSSSVRSTQSAPSSSANAARASVLRTPTSSSSSSSSSSTPSMPSSVIVSNDGPNPLKASGPLARILARQQNAGTGGTTNNSSNNNAMSRQPLPAQAALKQQMAEILKESDEAKHKAAKEAADKAKSTSAAATVTKPPAKRVIPKKVVDGSNDGSLAQSNGVPLPSLPKSGGVAGTGDLMDILGGSLSTIGSAVTPSATSSVTKAPAAASSSKVPAKAAVSREVANKRKIVISDEENDTTKAATSSSVAAASSKKKSKISDDESASSTSKAKTNGNNSNSNNSVEQKEVKAVRVSRPKKSIVEESNDDEEEEEEEASDDDDEEAEKKRREDKKAAKAARKEARRLKREAKKLKKQAKEKEAAAAVAAAAAANGAIKEEPKASVTKANDDKPSKKRARDTSDEKADGDDKKSRPTPSAPTVVPSPSFSDRPPGLIRVGDHIRLSANSIELPKAFRGYSGDYGYAVGGPSKSPWWIVRMVKDGVDIRVRNTAIIVCDPADLAIIAHFKDFKGEIPTLPPLPPDASSSLSSTPTPTPAATAAAVPSSPSATSDVPATPRGRGRPKGTYKNGSATPATPKPPPADPSAPPRGRGRPKKKKDTNEDDATATDDTSNTKKETSPSPSPSSRKSTAPATPTMSATPAPLLPPPALASSSNSTNNSNSESSTASIPPAVIVPSSPSVPSSNDTGTPVKPPTPSTQRGRALRKTEHIQVGTDTNTAQTERERQAQLAKERKERRLQDQKAWAEGKEEREKAKAEEKKQKQAIAAAKKEAAKKKREEREKKKAEQAAADGNGNSGDTQPQSTNQTS